MARIPFHEIAANPSLLHCLSPIERTQYARWRLRCAREAREQREREAGRAAAPPSREAAP